MATTPEERKAELLERLAGQVGSRVPAEQATAAQQFVHRYFVLVSPEDIIYAAPEALLGGAMSLWGYGEQRKPGISKVRAFNPTLKEHGWESVHSVLEVVNDDMPFLVDSVVSELQRRERSIHLLMHPVMTLRRDKKGVRNLDPSGEQITESYMHIEFDQETEPAELEAIRQSIVDILEEVRV